MRLLFFVFISFVSSLILELTPGQTRCLQEVLARHDLVKGNYKLLEAASSGERSGFSVRVRLNFTSVFVFRSFPLLSLSDFLYTMFLFFR